MKQGKYKRQIFITFLAVLTLLIVVFSSILFKILLDRSQAEKESAIIQSVKTSISNSQLKYEVISNAIDTVAESSAISEWEQSADLSHFYYNTIQVQKELVTAVSRVNNVAFEVAATYFDRDALVVTPRSSEDKGMYFSTTLELSDAQVERIYDYFSEKNGYMAFTIERSPGEPEICYITKRIYSERDILFITTFKYDTFAEHDEAYRWYLCNDRGIFAGTGDMDGEGLYQAFIENSWEGAFDYEGARVYPQTFSNVDWTVLYVYEHSGLDSSMLIIYLIMPLTALILLALVMTGYITRRLYKPMKEVMEDYLEGSSETAIDEFEVLKNNSNMIKGLNQQLKSALNERNTLLQQRLSRELLFGIKINRRKYPETWLKDADYAVAILEFIPDAMDEEDEDLFLYKNEIISFCQESEKHRYVSLNYFTFAIIIEATGEKEARALLNDLLEYIEVHDDQDIRIALSDVRKGLTAIPQCYDESSKIMEYKYLFNQSTILTSDQLNSFNQKTYYFPLISENKLIHSVLAGDVLGLTLYDQLVYQNDTNLNLSPEAFRNLIFALVGTVGRIMQEIKVDPETICGSGFEFTGLTKRWNEESICDEIRDILEKTISYVRESKENSESSLAKQMVDYVHQHYTEDIMLVDLAELLNVSEKYCGILFKKTVGENYKTYLNTYRIEQAKEIIYKDPEVKVADLAKWVGFNSSNTFIRVFTKHTGLTPKRYSEEYQIARKQKR